MEYSVRRAVITDLPRIEEIYCRARAFMAETGNPNQWGKTNPPTAQLIEDIEKSDLYVMEDESGIHGVFYFYIGEDPTYGKIYGGEWHSSAAYGTIHRIAGDGSGGVLRTAVAFCEEKTEHLRIDTHEDNKVMQQALDRQGFIRCGIIYIADGTPRIAYDRIKSAGI